MHADTRQLMKQFCIAFKPRGQVVLGGSVALQEGGPQSDLDWYIITDSLRECVRLKKQKHAIVEWKRQQGIVADIILLPRFFVRFRFYYVFGEDEQGNTVSPPFDRKTLRNNALKHAFRAYGNAIFSHGAYQRHQLVKGLTYALYAQGFSVNDPWFLVPPLFSRRRLQAHLQSCCFVSSDVAAVYQSILALRDSIEPVTDAHIAAVRAALEMAYNTSCTQLFSWRNQILYMVWAVRYKRMSAFFRHADGTMLASLRAAVDGHDRKLFEKIAPHIFQLVIV